MKLSELLTITGHHAEQYPHGGLQVFIGNNRDPRYWDCSDYVVRASLSGPSLHLVLRDAPKNPHAAALGRVGGRARQSGLTDAERVALASKGGQAFARKCAARHIPKPVTDYDRMAQAEQLRISGAVVTYTDAERLTWKAIKSTYWPPLCAIQFEKATGKPAPRD